MNISEIASESKFLIDILHWFMAILFVGWGIFMVYCMVHFRAREGGRAIYQPIKAKISKYVEISVVLFEAFLLVMGTNTLAYASSALSFALRNIGKPVVITGAARPFEDRASDAIRNLHNAIRTCLLPVAGILVVFGSRLRIAQRL